MIVAPPSIGIETVDDVMTVFIRRKKKYDDPDKTNVGVHYISLTINRTC